MEVTLSFSPITLLDVHHNSQSPSPPIIGHPIPWNLLKAHGDSCLCHLHNQSEICKRRKGMPTSPMDETSSRRLWR
ncbi:hypothetical protein Tco_1321966 [Tanacetum coccineum]